jgi:hypothetical protein
MRRWIYVLLPFIGAIGFAFFSELSLRPVGIFLWNAATMVWTLATFAALAKGKLRGRLTAVAVPAVMMIAVSTVMSLLFLDLVAPRRGFIAFFAIILYIFLEHVRREAADDTLAERLSISEFARMVNVGSLFLVASVGIGLTVFLPIKAWWTVPPIVVIFSLWSWHLYAACTERCERTGMRVLITTLVALETYLVVLTLPTSMFVGGALVGFVCYPGITCFRSARPTPFPPVDPQVRLVRRYVLLSFSLPPLLKKICRPIYFLLWTRALDDDSCHSWTGRRNRGRSPNRIWRWSRSSLQSRFRSDVRACLSRLLCLKPKSPIASSA